MNNNRDIEGNFLNDIFSSVPLPWDINQAQIDSLSQYIGLFIEWNRQFRFSRYSSPDDITTRLIIPSLVFSLLLPDNSRILDLGSGPGIPGIPIKILRPDLTMSLLESGHKQVEFLHLCVSELKLDKIDIIEGRAEILAHDPSLRYQFDSVIARAFAPLAILVETASAFLRPGGNITVQCSRSISSNLEKENDGITRVGSLFQRIGAIGSEVHPMELLYFAQFIQLYKAPPEIPGSWSKMKNQPLWD